MNVWLKTRFFPFLSHSFLRHSNQVGRPFRSRFFRSFKEMKTKINKLFSLSFFLLLTVFDFIQRKTHLCQVEIAFYFLYFLHFSIVQSKAKVDFNQFDLECVGIQLVATSNQAKPISLILWFTMFEMTFILFFLKFVC